MLVGGEKGFLEIWTSESEMSKSFPEERPTALLTK